MPTKQFFEFCQYFGLLAGLWSDFENRSWRQDSPPLLWLGFGTPLETQSWAHSVFWLNPALWPDSVRWYRVYGYGCVVNTTHTIYVMCRDALQNSFGTGFVNILDFWPAWDRTLKIVPDDRIRIPPMWIRIHIPLCESCRPKSEILKEPEICENLSKIESHFACGRAPCEIMENQLEIKRNHWKSRQNPRKSSKKPSKFKEMQRKSIKIHPKWMKIDQKGVKVNEK